MFRYIIRPQGILTTPRKLKEILGAQRLLRYPFSGVRRPARHRDLFLAYPPLEQLEDYHALSETETRVFMAVRNLYRANKPSQRNQLGRLGFPIPTTIDPGRTESLAGNTGNPAESNIYIARPFRHSSGRGYRLLSDTPQETEGVQIELLSSWNPAQEYLQELYPKRHEYRIIIIRGDPLITLLKRHPDISPLLPWNHARGSSFVTVTNPENNRLRHTDVYGVIENNREFFQAIDLCALDVLVNLRHDIPYVISEINFCPSVTIPSNLERIRNAFLRPHRN